MLEEVRMKKSLSSKQQKMLTFIRDFYQEHGLPPTVRDIQKACDISSTSVVDYNLHILQREGHIKRTPEMARGIEVLEDGVRRTATVQVPVMGYIAAGQPVPVPTQEGWASEPLETLEVPREMVRNQVYALRVKGLSMIDALIDDGDVVLVEPVHDVRNGQMAVAWLRKEQEATLKRFHREGERVRLQPANSQMEPIYVQADNVEVRGRVVGVLRMLK
jgi:repressor LexA